MSEAKYAETNRPVLQVRDLTVWKDSGSSRVPIIEQVSFDVQAGEAFALVGESGSGKSIALKAIMGLLPAGLNAGGQVLLDGVDLLKASAKEVRNVRGRSVALVMQDPFTCLSPLATCRRQLLMSYGGERNRDAEQDFVQSRLAEVGLFDFSIAERYPYQLSGGQSQRIAIAIAMAKRPMVLLLDEPTTALDVTTQGHFLKLLEQLQAKTGIAVVHVTHDVNVALQTCRSIGVMYSGSLVETGPSGQVSTHPAHPYTAGLIAADPPLDRRVADLRGLEGAVPSPGNRPQGCVFHARCAWAESACTTASMSLRQIGLDSATTCIRAESIRDTLEQEVRLDSREADELPSASRASEVVVSVEAIVKSFGSRRRRRSPVVALDGVSLQIRSGESVGLVGESGSGKTTLGRILVGLEAPSSGTATVAGVEITRDLGRHTLDRLHNVSQMAFQNPYAALNPARTVESTLREAVVLGGGAGDVRFETARVLSEVGLDTGYLPKRPAQLSGGERQRIVIARALARRPQLLVCDEVVSALDVSVQAQILRLLRDVIADRGISMLFVTHDLAVARQVCDTLYVMKTGRIVERGTTAEVLDSPTHDYTRSLLTSVPRRLASA